MIPTGNDFHSGKDKTMDTVNRSVVAKGIGVRQEG